MTKTIPTKCQWCFTRDHISESLLVCKFCAPLVATELRKFKGNWTPPRKTKEADLEHIAFNTETAEEVPLKEILEDLHKEIQVEPEPEEVEPETPKKEISLAPVRTAKETTITGKTTLIPEGHKKCKTCQEVLPNTEEHFPIGDTRRGKIWLRPNCKSCYNKASQASKQRRRDAQNEIKVDNAIKHMDDEHKTATKKDRLEEQLDFLFKQ